MAPRKARKCLSFLSRCILTFTWLTFLGAAAWLFGLDVTAIMLIHTGEYHVRNTFIAAVCVLVFSGFVNVTWGKHKNIPEMLVLVVHVVAFLLLLSLLAFANATGTVEANFTFTTVTGWSPSFGVLSVLYATNSITGFDCAAHIGKRESSLKQFCRLLLTFACSRRYCRSQQAYSNISSMVHDRQQASVHPCRHLDWPCRRQCKCLVCRPTRRVWSSMRQHRATNLQRRSRTQGSS